MEPAKLHGFPGYSWHLRLGIWIGRLTAFAKWYPVIWLTRSVFCEIFRKGFGQPTWHQVSVHNERQIKTVFFLQQRTEGDFFYLGHHERDHYSRIYSYFILSGIIKKLKRFPFLWFLGLWTCWARLRGKAYFGVPAATSVLVLLKKHMLLVSRSQQKRKEWWTALIHTIR